MYNMHKYKPQLLICVLKRKVWGLCTFIFFSDSRKGHIESILFRLVEPICLHSPSAFPFPTRPHFASVKIGRFKRKNSMGANFCRGARVIPSGF